MKIRMLVGMEGRTSSILPGQEVDVPDDVGKAWKAAGLAVEPPSSAVFSLGGLFPSLEEGKENVQQGSPDGGTAPDGGSSAEVAQPDSAASGQTITAGAAVDDGGGAEGSDGTGTDQPQGGDAAPVKVEKPPPVKKPRSKAAPKKGGSDGADSNTTVPTG